MNVQHIAQVVLDKPGRGRVYGQYPRNESEIAAGPHRKDSPMKRDARPSTGQA